MTGLELRTLRALRRGPLYIGALALIVGVSDKRIREIVRALNRQGYVGHAAPARVHTWQITEAGEEIVAAAMTPRCPVCGGLNPGDITHARC